MALIPSIEYLQGRGLLVVPGICIASRGPVESVRLFLKRKIMEVKRVALDESSLTSATLLRIILKERYGLEPEYFSWSAPSMQEVEADAVLLIGDNAMRVGNGLPSLDLGAEWCRLTHLPFVYAFWVTFSEERLQVARPVLEGAKRSGLNNLGAVALSESERLGLGPEVCLRYLSQCIHYHMGIKEVEGFRRFYEYALEMGVAQEGVELECCLSLRTGEGALKEAHKP